MKPIFYSPLSGLFTALFILSSQLSFAQPCDAITPSFTVDLSASPVMSWTSPPVVRAGNCCGTLSPDVCVEFIITLHPDAIAVNFDISSGAVPPGALEYQIDCGVPPTPVGDNICLTGPGPHVLTFCKPGANENTFTIQSYGEPIIGPDISLNASCLGMIHAEYYNEASITWTSVDPGPVGTYNEWLSCTAACDTTYVQAPGAGAPAYVDYMVCGDDAAGCNTNPICQTIRVTFIDPITVVTSPDTAICVGSPPITISATPLGGSGAYTYLWNTAETTSSISVGPGTYYVDVVDTSGCLIASDTTVVTGLALPPISAGSDQSVCHGDSITLIGSGAGAGGVYAWDNGVTNGVSIVQEAGTITYTVTGRDTNGCQNTDQVDIIVNPLPVINSGLDQTVCDGVAVTLNASGAGAGGSYAWDNGVTDGVAFVQAVGTITYTVIGTDANGCQNTDQVDLIVNPLPVISAGADQTVCEGVALTLNGSGAGAVGSYAWSNGITDGVSFVPAVGTIPYTVTGTDANGCQSTDEVDVTVNPLPIIIAGPDQEVCEGAAVTLNVSGAEVGGFYSWDSGVTDGVPFVQFVGTMTYTVTATDVNGCQNTDQVDVTVYPIPTIDAGLNQSVCEGDQVTLSGSGAVTYAWDNGITDGVSFTPPVGTTTYSVVGNDANGCSSSDQVEVTVNLLPVINAGPDQEVCSGVAVTLNGSGAGLGGSYSWDNGINDGVPIIQAVGTITNTVIGTDANGCQNTDQVDVTVNPLPNVDAGPDVTVCENTAVTLSGSGAVTYEWDNGITNGVPFIQIPGIVVYIVTGTDVNGCQNTDIASVTVNDNPVVDAGADQFVCDGEEIILFTNGVNPQWNQDVQNGVPFTQSVGIVQYIVYDTVVTSGCTTSDTMNLTVYPNPTVWAADVEICEGEGATLTGFGAVSYSWTGGIDNGSEFYPAVTDEYIITGTSAEGCTATDTALVIVNPLPDVDFSILTSSLTTTNSATGFDNQSTGASSYVWSFGDGSPESYAFEPTNTFPNDEAGTYEVTLTGTSDEGCVNQDIQYVYVLQDYTIYVPNAFTPDASNLNDVFKPEMEGFDEFDFVMYIFNRWGELVFETHDMEVGWDGTFTEKGIVCQDGVYTWKIVAKLADSDDNKLFAGHVSLLK